MRDSDLLKRIALLCCGIQVACNQADTPTINPLAPVEVVDPTLVLNPPCGLAGQTRSLVTGASWPEPQPPCTYHVDFDGQEVATQQDGLYGPPHVAFTVPADAEVGCGHTIDLKLIIDVDGTLIASASVNFCVVTFDHIEWVDTLCHGPCANPPEALGPEVARDLAGLRHFPDASQPDLSARDEVTVRAQLTDECPGVPVYFKSFDPVDYSAAGPPIRVQRACDDGQTMTCDNRGEPRAGTLEKAVVATDASGLAEVTFTTSMFPGDNYLVAAAADQGYLDGVFVGQFQAEDAAGDLLSSGRQADTNVKGVATPMLTVWRLLHLELDSMVSPGDQNYARGAVTASTCFTDAAASGLPGYCQLEIDPPLLPHTVGQYDKGEIRVGTQTFPVLPVGRYRTPTETIEPNLIWAVHTFLPDGIRTCPGAGSPPVCPSGDSFELHDDDNDALLPSTPDTMFLQDSDDPTTNRLFRAFVVPVHDGGGQNDVPWQANVDVTVDADVRPVLLGVESAIAEAKNCRSSPSYWCAYIQNAFQAGRMIDGAYELADHDPDGAVYPVDGSTATRGLYGEPIDDPRTGAIVLLETSRDVFRDSPIITLRRSRTTLHELGHVLLGCHGDKGVMCYPLAGQALTDARLNFTDQTISKIRWLVQPSQLPPQFVYKENLSGAVWVGPNAADLDNEEPLSCQKNPICPFDEGEF